MPKNAERPRSTRTAIIALGITAVGVVVSALALYKTNSETAPEQSITSDSVENSTLVVENSSAPSIQAGRDVNVGRDINILPVEKLPDEILIVTEKLRGTKNNLYDLYEAPAIAEYCPGSMASLENVTDVDIPLTIGEFESDAGTMDAGTIKSKSSIRYKMPEYQGEFVLYNTSDENPYFFFRIKKC